MYKELNDIVSTVFYDNKLNCATKASSKDYIPINI